MINSDDLYIQTHDKPQLYPTKHNHSGTLHGFSKLCIKVWFWSKPTYMEMPQADDRCETFKKKRRICL